MIRRLIREGDVMPWGYGVAYRTDFHCGAVCYPFPLNRIVGLAVSLWEKVHHSKAQRQRNINRILNETVDEIRAMPISKVDKIAMLVTISIIERRLYDPKQRQTKPAGNKEEGIR